MPENIYKVKFITTQKKYTIVADSFEQLCVKSKKRLNIDTNVEVLVCLEDETEIDSESFLVLQKNSVLTISLKSETIQFKRRKFEHSRPDRSLNDRFTGIMNVPYFVDKSMFIENFINCIFEKSAISYPVIKKGIVADPVIVDPVLFLAPRRFGKTTILHMLDAFFSGALQQDKLEKLNVYKSELAMKWYGKFVVIHISFGSAGGSISSHDEAMTACRSILRAAYKDYAYVIPSLNDIDAKEYKSWLDHEESKNKDIGEITGAIKFLVDCVICHHNFEKKCILLIDEFDRLSSKAMFHCESGILNQIVDLYSDMIGIPVKHASGASWCYGIFTGVTSITSYTASSLNNLNVISILNDERFSRFYGFTIQEFEEVMQRNNIPEQVKKWKNYAESFYNGYRIGSVSLLNTYSVKQFIESGTKPTTYWKDSGVPLGLSRALRFKKWRKLIMILMTGGFLHMRCVKSINVDEFKNIFDPCFELINLNTVLNLLYQQGYLCITTEENDVESAKQLNFETGDVSMDLSKTEETFEDPNLLIGEKVCVKRPNIEVQLEFGKQLEVSFACSFDFDQNSLRECATLFLKMDLSNDTSCKVALEKVKTLINEMLGSTKKRKINESWLEKFLYHIFVEHFVIKTQEKIPETVPKNADLRSARVFDMYIEANGRCFIFEESAKYDTEETLKKMIEKKYYVPAQKTGLPFLLIAFSLKADSREYAHVDIRFLRDRIEGGGIEVP